MDGVMMFWNTSRVGNTVMLILISNTDNEAEGLEKTTFLFFFTE